MPKKSPWSDLTDEQKDDLVRRRYINEESIVDLAKEVGMKRATTLGRRLREWREENEDRLSDAVFQQPPEFTDDYKRETKGNTMSATSPRVEGRILTLDQLLAACEVDLEEWEVERYIVNKWEMGRKDIEKDLSWSNGVADGYTRDSGQINIEALYQVKAWLIRKKPIELFPIVQPVQINVSLPDDRIIFRPEERPLGTVVVVPDIHIGFYRDLNTGELEPFHDRGALGLVLDVVKNEEPDQIVFLGDNLDLPDWSDKFIRSPEFRNVTQPAVDELAWWLAQFRVAAPDANMVYLEGNHEDRMVKARQTNMIAAFDLRPASKVGYPPALSIPSLVELDALDVHWVGGYPDAHYWVNERLVLTHGSRARQGAAATSKAMLQLFNASVVYGHIHRTEWGIESVLGRFGPEVHRAICPGALCRMDGTVPGHVSAQDWSQGFAVVYHDTDGFNITPVEISEDRAIYGSLSYRKNWEYEELLRDDLSHWRY